MNNNPNSRLKTFVPLAQRVIIAALLVCFGIWLGRGRHRGAEPPASNTLGTTATEHGETDQSSAATVTFEKSRQAAVGIRTAIIGRGEMRETLTSTGKIELNDDRVAHVNSLVEGVLREVRTKIGSEVAADQILAIVDSKEIGQAKLDLAKSRMNVEFARAERDWTQLIRKNTEALISDLEKLPDVSDLERRFRDHPMGDNRQLLIAGYSRYRQTKADHDRLQELRKQNIGVEKDYIRATADFESASATYQATLEQLKYNSKYTLLVSERKFQEALMAERTSRALLLVFGYREADIDKLDPLAEGEKVSHYPVRAPFAGTIIAKHAVLSEHVGPTHQLFQIADLSTVWLEADIFEKDLAALDAASQQPFRFRTTSYPTREFTATLFHLGDQVDERSRAVRLIATADNKDRALKTGMFAEVTLPIGEAASCVQVPTEALQRNDDRDYVFAVIDDEHFEQRPVRIGRRAAGFAEVVDGLQPGERVVTAGAFALKSEMLKGLLGE